MKYVQVDSERKVSALQFGCSRLGKALKEDTSKIGPQILEQALASGINFFDTASNYAYGNSELLLGEFARKHRDKVFVVTKGGVLISKKASYARFLKPIYGLLRPIVNRINPLKRHKKRTNFDFDFLRTTLNESLERMGLDHVDVYFTHNPSHDVLRNPNTSDFFSSLKSTNKCKYTGHSVKQVEDLNQLASFDQVDFVQVPLNYSSYSEGQLEILQELKARGIKIIARCPFARGLLTNHNKVKTGRLHGSRDNEIIEKKRKLKERFKLTEIELALWFVRDMGIADFILFSTFKSDHLAENIQAFDKEIDSEFSWRDLITSMH